MIAISLMVFGAACNKGSTEGDSETAGIGDHFVSDGGSGGSIELELTGDLSVGGQTGFFVRLRDPQGQPLEFVRVFCESERGLAIIEPSSGGVAYESTGADGNMSGVVGGLLPGSFLLECRAPQGYNLVARQTVRVTGTVPDGFAGFPGAAGGNLGGGVIIDNSPDSDDIALAAFTVNDGEDDVTAVDIIQTSDCDGDVDTVDPEPFYASTFTITVRNPTGQRLFIETVGLSVAQSSTVTSLVELATCEVAPNSSATCTGPFADFSGSTLDDKALAGSGVSFEVGTFNVSAEVSGTTENGESFTLTGGRALTFDGFNNCG